MLLMMGSLLFAQGSKAINAGNIMIGGDVTGFGGVSSMKVIDEDGEEVAVLQDSFVIQLSGSMGFFVIDGLEVGPDVELLFDSSNESDDSYTVIGIGAQIGYYLDLGGMMAFFGKASAKFLMQTESGGGTDSSATGFQVTPEAGIALFLNNNAAIQIGGVFNYSSVTPEDANYSYQTMEFGAKIGAAIFM